MNLKTFKDKDGDVVYVIPNVKFTGNINKDIKATLKTTGKFLYNKLGSNEGVTDKGKNIIYWGADVQDSLGFSIIITK